METSGMSGIIMVKYAYLCWLLTNSLSTFRLEYARQNVALRVKVGANPA
jgi:hypothetical protein